MSLSRSQTRVAIPREGAASWLRFGDPVLLLAGLGLTAFGIFAMYVAGADDGQSYALDQLVGFVVGLAVAVPLALVDYKYLKRYLWWIYAAAVASLVFVLVFGAAAGGAQRWIFLGPIQVQPSEFVKTMMVIVLAGYVADHYAGNSATFLRSLALISLPALLVFAQPDLGTALVFGAVFLVVAFIGGAKLWQLGALLALGAALSALAVRLGILADYQVARLTAFISPESSSDYGYQVVQSQNAIGSGGLTGKGLGEATLGNLGFLPEDQTDFIFSNVAERLGFVGSIILLVLFFVLIWRILHISTMARDRFGLLLAAGLGTIFLFHASVNLGMAMGIMPVTGIPLPFISYGRSSLVVSVISLGILQSIAMRSRAESSRQLGA
ncbi:MAG: rod shape-determining protein RodA [Rubrobacter sp.]|jgi:rod shape determining protein RodA|nr:rod shape-determining protein RodA [Rubrobacter sp.]